MKRRTILPIIGFMLLITSPPAAVQAEGGGQAIVLKLQDPNAVAFGKPYRVASPPVLIQDVTMVPLRFVGEALGADIEWNEETRAVKLTTAANTVTLTIDSKEAAVGGRPVTLEQPAMILNESTMVPLRFVAEQLGQTVTFNSQNQTITLTPSVPQPIPAPASVPASAPERQKLSPPTVDNLVPDPDAGQHVAWATQVLSVAVDRHGNIYSLRNYASDGYTVSKYEPAADRTSTIFRIDGKLNFDFEVIPGDTDSFYDAVPRKGTFVYADFHPYRLYYNPGLDRVYILGWGVAYSLEPEVKMETHGFTALEPVPFEAKFGQQPRGYSDLPEMFETVDGELFYVGGDQAIYSQLRGGGYRFVTNTYIEPNSQLVSTVKDQTIYTYDMTTGSISILSDNTLKKTTQALIDGAVYCTGANGSFYVMTPAQIHKVTADGQSMVLADRENLKFNKGLYKEKTKVYEPIAANDTSELLFNKFVRFTADRHDNIILYDERSRMVRRINVYSPEGS